MNRCYSIGEEGETNSVNAGFQSYSYDGPALKQSWKHLAILKSGKPGYQNSGKCNPKNSHLKAAPYGFCRIYSTLGLVCWPLLEVFGLHHVKGPIPANSKQARLQRRQLVQVSAGRGQLMHHPSRARPLYHVPPIPLNSLPPLCVVRLGTPGRPLSYPGKPWSCRLRANRIKDYDNATRLLQRLGQVNPLGAPILRLATAKNRWPASVLMTLPPLLPPPYITVAEAPSQPPRAHYPSPSLHIQPLHGLRVCLYQGQRHMQPRY